MANIDKELQAIQDAIYGEEVRSSIHDAIKAVNDSATDSALVCETKAKEALESAKTALEKALEILSTADESKSYAVGGTGTREGEDTDNAKYYMERAKEVAKVDVATTETAGIVKPDGTTINVSEDGTINVPDATTEKKGVVKLSDSSDVTDSTGLALPATEKNADIEGTLANQFATLNSNFITLTATLGSAGTSISVDYPTGFNPNNCIVSCAKLELATDVFVSNVYSGETMFEPILFSSYISFATHSGTAVGKQATIVLKKI